MTCHQSLLYLHLKNKFNQCLRNYPPNLLFIKFGNRFNQPLYGLPSTLKLISFGYDFNQPLLLKELPNLSYLKFGRKFDQKIGKLPLSLTHLAIFDGYRHKISHPININFILNFYFGHKKFYGCQHN